MSDPANTEESAQRASAVLQNLPPEEWGTWLVGFFEGLESRMETDEPTEAFDAALRAVQHYLEKRLLRDMRQQ